MFTSLFVWAYSIPIVFIMLIFGAPIAIPLFACALFISTSLQLIYKEPISVSIIRTIMNNINLSYWFGKIDHVELPEKAHLICSHPHNVFCLGALLSVHFQPKSKTLIAVAPLIFHIPLLGWIAAQCGCIPSSKQSITNALDSRLSVILVVGGVPEVVSYERNELYTNRHQFLKFDYPILPVVTTSKHYYVPQAPLYDLRMFVAENYSVPIIFPWVFGWRNTWLPERKPVTVKVLEVKKRTEEEYFKEIKETIYN
jgi:hypothetical protein